MSRDGEGLGPKHQVILTPEARAAAVGAAAEKIGPEAKAGVSPSSMIRIQKAVSAIPYDRLRMIMADNKVSDQEVRMTLTQAGVPAQDIAPAVEYTRRMIDNYARAIIPPEQSLSHLAEALQDKVDQMGDLLKGGTISPEIKKQSVNTPLAQNNVPDDKGPDEKKLF